MENNKQITGNILPEWKNEIFIESLKKMKGVEIHSGVRIAKCRYDSYHECFVVDLENESNLDNDEIQKKFYQIFAKELTSSTIEFLKQNNYNPNEFNKSIMFETSCNGKTITIR